MKKFNTKINVPLPKNVSSPNLKKLKKPSRKMLIIALLVVIVGTTLYFFRGAFIVATVNGMPITRAKLWAELEKQGGKQVTEALIVQSLIDQEAKKQNITVTDEELREELVKIEEQLSAQGLTLDLALEQQGMSRKDLLSQLTLQKKLEKMVGTGENAVDAQTWLAELKGKSSIKYYTE